MVLYIHAYTDGRQLTHTQRGSQEAMVRSAGEDVAPDRRRDAGFLPGSIDETVVSIRAPHRRDTYMKLAFCHQYLEVSLANIVER